MKLINNNKNKILLTVLKFSSVLIILVYMFTPFVFTNAENEKSSTDIKIETKIQNPIGEKIDTIPKFIEEVINIVLVVGVPIVVLAIIYTGFLFVSAQGNPEKLIKAKKALLYTLIGAALLLGAFVIANAIQSTVDDIKSNA